MDKPPILNKDGATTYPNNYVDNLTWDQTTWDDSLTLDSSKHGKTEFKADIERLNDASA